VLRSRPVARPVEAHPSWRVARTVLLAASLLGNLVAVGLLLASDGAPPSTPAPRREPAAGSSRTCEGRLAACRSGSSRIEDVLGRLSLAGPSRRTAPDASARSPGGATDGPEAQDEVLCHIARRTAQETWFAQRDAITRSLRRSLGNIEEQERNVRDGAARFAAAVGLDPRRASELESRYRPLRLGRVKRIEELVAAKDPPDYPAVLAEARALFGEEDALAQELFGAEASARLRTGELEGRTAIVAILTALSGRVLDEALPW
jgi:hypothetical protein